MEDSEWYPFIYTINQKATGIQVEIVEHALKSITVEYSLSVLPWKRCLDYVKQGKYDSAIGASFNYERSKYMNYPLGAEESYSARKPHDKRIAQSNYVVLNLKSQSYEFNGDLKSIPSPIYVPLGFSIADDLRKKGLEVDSNSKSDMANIKKLKMHRIGSVILVYPLAKKYIETNKEGKKFKISQKPVVAKNNYMTFSKKSSVSKNLRVKIWNEIGKTREKMINHLILKH
jgi:polar amino acid transport system substrate-binding protein